MMFEILYYRRWFRPRAQPDLAVDLDKKTDEIRARVVATLF